MRMPLLLLVSSLTDAAVAGAQAERRISVFVGGGLAVPNAPDAFRDGWEEGFDLVVGAGFPLASKLTLQGTVAYDRLSYHESPLSSDWRAAMPRSSPSREK